MTRLVSLLAVLALSWTAESTGTSTSLVLDTCDAQARFVNIEITPSTPGVNGAPSCARCNQYRVCLTLRGVPNNCIDYTCVKPSSTCCGDQHFNSFTSSYSSNAGCGRASGNNTPAANNVAQCQFAQAGTCVYFLLKDGFGCRPSPDCDTPDYARTTVFTRSPSGVNVSVNAECRSRTGWYFNGEYIPSCNLLSILDSECVWKVQLPGPDCASPAPSPLPSRAASPSRSAAPSLAASPLSTASPLRSASPAASPAGNVPASPAASPPGSAAASPGPANDQACQACASAQQPQQCMDVDQMYAGKPITTIPNCDFNVLRSTLQPYRCAPVEGCDTLVCQDRIPSGELEKAFQTCRASRSQMP